jgi:hypothetical protein
VTTTTAAGNAALAARARDLAGQAGRGSVDRLAGLSLSACLSTATSIAGARKALAEIERPDLRQRAGEILAELVDRSSTK